MCVIAATSIISNALTIQCLILIFFPMANEVFFEPQNKHESVEKVLLYPSPEI